MKNFKNNILLLLIFVSLLSFVNIDLEKKVVGKVNILVPTDFYKMDDNDIVVKYGMTELPKALYTNRENDILLSVRQKDDTLNYTGKGKYKKFKVENNTNIEIEKSFRKASIQSEFLNTRYFTDTTYSDGKTSFIKLEFTGTLTGENNKGEEISSQNYNYIVYAFQKKRNFIINFSCPEAEKEAWKPIANKIMNDLEFK